MRYSRRPSSILAMLGTPLAVAGIIGVLILVLRFVFPGALMALVTPLWNIGSAGARSALPESEASVKAERDELRAQVDTLLAEKLALEVALATLGVDEITSGTPVRVLARPPVTPYDILIVLAGEGESVRTGQSVYGPGGTPLGIVQEVGTSRSSVILFSAAGKETLASIAEVPVTLIGQGSGAFVAHVAADAPIVEGDLVLVEGVPIGSVARVEKDAASPEATLRLRPVVNPFTLSWVRIDTRIP